MVETKRIQVGSIALARRQTGVCKIGEIGVCYEVYSLDNRSGYSFLFQSGRYDGFSPDDVSMFLMVTEEVCPTITDYQFRSVMQLYRDLRIGNSNAILAMAPPERNPHNYSPVAEISRVFFTPRRSVGW